MPRTRLKYVHRYITRHGEAIFYYRRGQSGRIRLPDTYGTPEFLEAYQLAASGERPKVARIGRYERRTERIASAFATTLSGCKARAAQKGRGFDLTVEWLCDLARRQDFRCAVTGIALDLKNPSRRDRRNPFAPSIDRINSKGGYTKDNVRIVALAVNIMLADWGEEVLAHVAESLLVNRKRPPMCSPRNAGVPTSENATQQQ